MVLLSTDLKSILHYSAVGRRRRLEGESGSLKLVSPLDENAEGGCSTRNTYMIWQNAAAFGDGSRITDAVGFSFDNFVRIHAVMMALI